MFPVSHPDKFWEHSISGGGVGGGGGAWRGGGQEQCSGRRYGDEASLVQGIPGNINTSSCLNCVVFTFNLEIHKKKTYLGHFLETFFGYPQQLTAIILGLDATLVSVCRVPHHDSQFLFQKKVKFRNILSFSCFLVSSFLYMCLLFV